jgi:hypothetical protein
MSQQADTYKPPDPLDELVEQLLSCGGVLSQMLAGMLEFDASGRSSPDAAPIPDTMRTLIRSVVTGVGKRYSKRDLRVAAAIVDQVTDSICEEIYYIPPEALDALERR